MSDSVNTPVPSRRVRNVSGTATARPRPTGSDEDLENRVTPDAVSTRELLRVLVAVTGRVAFPEKHLRLLVTPTENPAYIAAYHLCDGTRTIADVARGTALDPHNLRKVLAHWIDPGIIFRVGHDARPLNLYQLLPGGGKKASIKDEPPSDAKGEQQ